MKVKKQTPYFFIIVGDFKQRLLLKNLQLSKRMESSLLMVLLMLTGILSQMNILDSMEKEHVC